MSKLILALAVAVFIVAGCSEDSTSPRNASDIGQNLEQTDELGFAGSMIGSRSSGKAVIANRGSGNISVIDGHSLSVTGTYDLPAMDGEPTPEPMYVVHVSAMNRVFVGDRANNRVAVFDANNFDVEATVAAGSGVFHMWADPQGKQLWVNNDIDNTTTVIDPVTLDVITTVPTPADLVAMGGKPHDVIVGPKGRYAYVTVLGISGPNDYVVQFSTSTFQEMNRAPVGKDPHLSLARQHPWLYVPCQESDQVVVLNRYDLEEETVIDIPGAHGAIMSRNGKIFYTTNLTGGGTDAVFAIDTKSNTMIGQAVDTPYPVPHNLALDPSGRSLFVTHSGGASDKVTVFRTGLGGTVAPQYLGEVTVGLNPFGLAYVN